MHRRRSNATDDKDSNWFNMKIRAIYAVMTILFSIVINSNGTTKDDPMTAFEQFIQAQNQHDLTALNNLLDDSPDFLWITKGQTIWGKESSLKRFESLFKGTWTLEPDRSNLKIITLDKNSRHIYVPITFSIGEPGQEPKQIKFLMNMILINKSGTWKVSAILPIQTVN
jgi:hypothetical protein